MQYNVLFFLKQKNHVKFLYDHISIKDGLALMRETGFTAMPVISSSGYYVGTITEGDFLWYISDHMNDMSQKDIDETPVKALIRKDFMPAITINVPIYSLFDAALHQNFIPVVDDRNIFIGIVTRQRIIRHFIEEQGQTYTTLPAYTNAPEIFHY
jgi:CBS domain-containing protein